MDKKKNPKLQITEMFCAQAGSERTFFGSIKRGEDENGEKFVFSRIVVNDGLICAREIEQDQLALNLDKILIMVLDLGLHKEAGKTIKILNTDLFLN
jgi:hypothetical protein